MQALANRLTGRNRHSLKLLIPAFLAVLTSACGSTGATTAPDTLAGTSWQLVAIRSKDDAQATLRIDDPSLFTLTLGRDGQASLKLDCNKGIGQWEHQPAAADGGSFQFGPIATTRALCPPPHLDERIARDLPHVRSYRIQNGKQSLSLFADGGIYEWAPAPR